MTISILIPTLRRPESLDRALRSALAQAADTPELLEVVVVDNSPEGSARGVVERVGRGSPVPIPYVHEARPGVATARNAGLAVAAGELIAFLDDDEEAPAGWLRILLETHQALAADVTFSAIKARVPENAGWTTSYLERLFSRSGPANACLVEKPWGCGASLMNRHVLGVAPFDTSHDQIGGEDDALFRRLRQERRRFAWAPQAWVWEHPPAHRATLRYALKRAFAYGQGPSQSAAAHRNALAVASWMAVGAAQVLAYGAAAAVLSIVRHPARADLLDRAARGLGKILWMPVFEPRFYGVAELRRSAAA